MLERASIVRDAGGRAVRAVGAMQDVSGPKVAEEATLRLAAIVASASDAIVGKTTDGIITSWNAAAERLFGYTEAEVLGHSVFMLVPPELHGAERDLLARVRRGERVEFSTTERLRKDGSRLAVSLTVSPIWDASGAVVGVSSIQRDVTDRQRAAEELARREERYRALVLATTSVVWTTDPDGRFVEPQPAGSSTPASRGSEHRGWAGSSALHPDDRAGCSRPGSPRREHSGGLRGRGAACGIGRTGATGGSSSRAAPVPWRRRRGAASGSARSPTWRTSARPKSGCARPIAWSPSGASPAASPTRPTIR